MAPPPDKGNSFSLAGWVVSRAQAMMGRSAGPIQSGSLNAAAARAEPSFAPPSVTSNNAATPQAPNRTEWFGPGKPMTPMAPAADVAGRAFDYPAYTNVGITPRQYNGVSFEQLRGLSTALDVVRLCIETRKDQMSKLTFGILPIQEAGQSVRKKADARCAEVTTFLRRPDRKHAWAEWMRMLLEDQFVIDAASIYVRRDNAGRPYSLDVVDGATIKPLLDVTGRMPDAPSPAYQQILKGMPAIDYTADELLYAVRNPRSNHMYGYSVVEQMMVTINIAIRREIAKMNYFTEGNIPEAMVSVPEDWTPDVIMKFQQAWDAMLKSQSEKAGLKFVPGKMNFVPTRSDGMLMGPFDEWIARVCCFAFSLPPTAFVQQQNRATAEQANDTALEEGLAPLMVWWKSVMDHIIQVVFGYADLEFVFDDVSQVDVAQEEARELEEIRLGLRGIDEVRAKRGLDPIGMGPAIFGIGPNGIMFVDDLLKAKAAGLLALQPPAPPQQFDAMGNPLPPDPSQQPPGTEPGAIVQQAAAQLEAPAPQLNAPAEVAQSPVASQPDPAPRRLPPPGPDPLALIPAGILAAIGLGPDGKAGRTVDVTRKDAAQTDPETAHVGHPQILATLRAAEARHAARSS